MMAIFHSTIKCVSRGQGESLAQKAAYISGRSFYDDYCGETRYQYREDVVFKEVILPQNAPSEYSDEQTFVTEIDRSEKRRNSQTAREVIFSLPIELSLEKQIELACMCINEFWISRGMCAYMAIHDNNTGNPHAHVLLTTRNVDSNGFSKKKNRDWNKREIVHMWREYWANAQNLALERYGCEARVSHLSYEARGTKETPTKYLGPKASALERDGISTDRGNENRAILAEREQKLEAKREQEARKARKKRRRRGRTY